MISKVDSWVMLILAVRLAVLFVDFAMMVQAEAEFVETAMKTR